MQNPFLCAKRITWLPMSKSSKFLLQPYLSTEIAEILQFTPFSPFFRVKLCANQIIVNGSVIFFPRKKRDAWFCYAHTPMIFHSPTAGPDTFPWETNCCSFIKLLCGELTKNPTFLQKIRRTVVCAKGFQSKKKSCSSGVLLLLLQVWSLKEITLPPSTVSKCESFFFFPFPGCMGPL